jgi:hypothetical protein
LETTFFSKASSTSAETHGSANLFAAISRQEVHLRIPPPGVTIEAVSNFLQTYHDCRLAILSPIQQALDNAAVEALLEETIQAIDELASHYSLDEIYADQTSVKSIGSQQITYEAEGTVDVTLQWGSNSDVRNGDGAELSENFPFKFRDRGASG